MKNLFLTALLAASLQFINAATPVLSANSIQACYPGTTKPILNIKSGSAQTSYISAVIDDRTDCAATKGIFFTATENPTSFIITSDNKSVVPTSNITMTQTSSNQYVCKITPIAIGFTTINIIANNGSSSAAYKFEYAASVHSGYGPMTIYPTGIADASAAVTIDENYMFVADDETNIIRLYNRNHSGQDVYNVDITTNAGGINGEEFDIEGGTSSSNTYNSGNRIYWIASLGNSKSGNLRPYRDRVIATDISGIGETATLTVKSYSTNMRSALVAWGNTNSWDFTSSAAEGMIAKRIDGFNIEGLTLSNNGETAYVGFRAPCVPIQGTAPNSSNRQYALLAPITNFETMMNVDGNSSITPTVGDPILFDFGGLGIRSIEKVGGDKYIIVAGLFEGDGTPGIYLWDGTTPSTPGTTPITAGNYGLTQLSLETIGLTYYGGHPEALVADQIGTDLFIHLICDNGSVEYYNDGTEAKDLTNIEHMKYRMDTFIHSLTGDKRLFLLSGASNQTVAYDEAITNIVYAWTGDVNQIDMTGLADDLKSKTYTAGKNKVIYGNATEAGVHNYTIGVWFTNGSYKSLTGTITVLTTDIKKSNQKKIQVIQYKDQLQISGVEVSNIKIISLTGLTLFEKNNKSNINIGHLNQGAFILLITTKEGNVICKKFINK